MYPIPKPIANSMNSKKACYESDASMRPGDTP